MEGWSEVLHATSPRTQGEERAVTAGHKTVGGQANPLASKEKGFLREKLVTGDLAGKKDATCCTTEVSRENAFSQHSNLLLHQLCSRPVTWCGWGCLVAQHHEPCGLVLK